MSKTKASANPAAEERSEVQDRTGPYRGIFENSRAVMLVVDPEKHLIVDANAASCRFYGYSRAAMQGMPVRTLNTGMPEKIASDIREAASNERDYFLVRHRKASGEIRDVEIYSGPFTTGDRSLLLSIVHDVTERLKTERALRESEERFRTLFEDSVLGIYRTTPSGEILMANPALCTMLGYGSVEELRARNLQNDGYHPAYPRENFKERLEQDGVIRGLEAVWIKADGSSITVRENARAVRDADGGVIWYEGTVEDITQRKLAEEHLRQREEQFRMISENVSDIITLLDREGRRIYSSPSAGKLFPDPEALRGRDVFTEIHSDDRDCVRQIFREIVRTGKGQRVEYRLVAADGRVRSIESQASAITDADGAVINILVVSRDITEKKAMDQQLLRSQRMESLGTLASGIAHDLNNVLSPILMSIETLRKKLPEPRDQKLLNSIESSVSRGSAIVKQVLGFGRGMKGERILLQPRHVIKEVLKIAEETFPKSISLRMDAPKDLWTISADPTQMHQVLLNLCVNARDAMPEGGILTVSAENVTLDENYASLNIEASPGPHVALSVSDTGTGIHPHILERIFEPFFTTKDPGYGTGLGLSTGLAIVKGHGGFFTVYSEAGKGSTFRAYLPALENASPDQGPPADDAALPHGHGELILVVDDEANIRDVTKETLEAGGYRVLTAIDGTHAVATYAEHRESIDAVITDMIMPFMDGLATIRAIRKLSPGAIIIANSGFAGDPQTTRAVQSGADAFLTKPYTARKLLGILHETLGKR